MIETKVQRLHPCFRGWATQIDYWRTSKICFLTFVLRLSTGCLVTALSFGAVDNAIYNGYITAGITTISTNNRGFTIAQHNVTSCNMFSTRSFDTWLSTSESINMANYINGLPMSTVLIGVTADEPTWHLETTGRNALSGLGVGLSGLVFRGKVASVVQIGRPSVTVSRLAPAGGNNLQISVMVQGICCEFWQVFRTHVIIEKVSWRRLSLIHIRISRHLVNNQEINVKLNI